MRLGNSRILGLMLVSLAIAITAWAESERPQCPSEQPGACFVVELPMDSEAA